MKKAIFNKEIEQADLKLAEYCEKTGQDLTQIKKYCNFVANPLGLKTAEEKAAKYISEIIDIVDIQGDETKKYYLEHNERKIYFNEIPKGTYYCTGWDKPEERGNAMYMVFNQQHGTCLTPIIETKSNKIHNNRKAAGGTSSEGSNLSVKFFNKTSI